MSDNTTILVLAGQLGRALARIPLDSEQVADVAAVLRVLSDAVRHGGVTDDLVTFSHDLDDVAKDLESDGL